MTETFTEAATLARELDALQSGSEAQEDPTLRREVLYFIMNVCDEADKAFDDVDAVLSRISSLPSDASEKVVMKIHKEVMSTYSREKFKKVQKICDRLDELGNHFERKIRPRLGAAYIKEGSQLFWLLERNEAVLIDTIQYAFYGLSQQLVTYKVGADVLPIRQTAMAVHKDLRKAVGELRRIRVSAEALNPEGPVNLLSWKEEAEKPTGGSAGTSDSAIRKDIADLNSLILTHKRRLQILEEQRAQYGASVDPRIIIEIQDIGEELTKLRKELKALDK
jgi:hypothetical protein